ncbi:MAG: sulfite exporter TauE/SafE family protein [Phycisphaerae bacterium]|nr:sulfite exporter TauE/SafE family protein [Tepidisphaeraceae bacterium]
MESAHSLNHPAFLISFGVFVGVFSGLMGLGGGAVMIPIMVLVFGLSQPMAHGTSLAAMIPPVTLPAVINYYKNDNVDWRFAAYMAAGILVGSFFGAWLANKLPKEELKLVFGFILVYVAGYTVFSYFGKQHLTRSVVLAAVLAVVTVGMFVVVRAIDGKGVERQDAKDAKAG